MDVRQTDGSELLSIEPGWWPIDEMKNYVKFNWVESNETGSYTYLDADISVDEARLLHEQFKPLAHLGRYASSDAQDFIKGDLEAIESAVGERAKTDGPNKEIHSIDDEGMPSQAWRDSPAVCTTGARLLQALETVSG